MSGKVPCRECGVPILPATSNRTGGRCMPCKNGYRRHIEEARARAKRERELDATCPFRAYWRELVDRVHRKPEGFGGLSEDEKLYFAVNCLEGEVYNGGFVQFFDNSSGEYYEEALEALRTLDARESEALLMRAKDELFGEASVPKDREERWKAMKGSDAERACDVLDKLYWQDPDGLAARIEQFALDRGLVQGA